MKKTTRLMKLYAIVTQGFFTTIVLIALGIFIGYKINKDSPWPVILAVVGGLSGIVSLVTILLKTRMDGDDN